MQNENFTEMIEKKIPSAYPYWLVGLFWLFCSLIFPFYKLTHFLIVGAFSIVVFFVSKKLIPPKTVLVKAPKTPAYSGDFDIGQTELEYLEKLRDYCERIENETIKKKIKAISEVSKSIFEYIHDKPERTNEIRKLTSYYLPTAIKILDAYDRMEEQSVKGPNIACTLESIEKSLEKLEKAFETLLDNLYSAEKIDIETDIEVLESMLAQEGISTSESYEIKLQL